jgi:hypothetical protein
MAVATTTLIAIAAVSTAASLAATGVAVHGQIQQGKAQKQIADYNAKVARNNAIAARQQAQFEADRIRDKARRLAGSQRAAFSKSGIELSGSVNDVMFDSAIELELDALSAIYKGEVAGNNQTAQAEIFKMRGDAAKTGSQLAAAGTAIGGIGDAGSQAVGTINAVNLNEARTNNPTLNPFGSN